MTSLTQLKSYFVGNQSQVRKACIILIIFFIYLQTAEYFLFKGMQMSKNNLTKRLATDLADLQEEEKSIINLKLKVDDRFKNDKTVFSEANDPTVLDEFNKLESCDEMYRKKYFGVNNEKIDPRSENLKYIPDYSYQNATNQEIGKYLKTLGVGEDGCYFPEKLGHVMIVVPYRDRLNDLRVFSTNLHNFLINQYRSYCLVLSEQSDKSDFNRAKLLNVGFREGNKHFMESTKTQIKYETRPDCIIFSDVDLIPENYGNLHACLQTTAVHMCDKINKYGYKAQFIAGELFSSGGVLSVSRKMYENINGHSNWYWGWGAEDHDMSFRLLGEKSGYKSTTHSNGTTTTVKKQGTGSEKNKSSKKQKSKSIRELLQQINTAHSDDMIGYLRGISSENGNHKFSRQAGFGYYKMLKHVHGTNKLPPHHDVSISYKRNLMPTKDKRQKVDGLNDLNYYVISTVKNFYGATKIKSDILPSKLVNLKLSGYYESAFTEEEKSSISKLHSKIKLPAGEIENLKDAVKNLVENYTSQGPLVHLYNYKEGGNLDDSTGCDYKLIEKACFDKHTVQPWTFEERQERIENSKKSCEKRNIEGIECNGFRDIPTGVKHHGYREVDTPFSVFSRILTKEQLREAEQSRENGKSDVNVLGNLPSFINFTDTEVDQSTGKRKTHFSVIRTCSAEPGLVQLAENDLSRTKLEDDNPFILHFSATIMFQEKLKGRLYYMDKVTHEDKLVSRDINEMKIDKTSQNVFETNNTRSVILLERNPEDLGLDSGIKIDIFRQFPKSKPGMYVMHVKLTDVFSQPYMNLNIIFRIRNSDGDLEYETKEIKEGKKDWFIYGRDAMLRNNVNFEWVAKNLVEHLRN